MHAPVAAGDRVTRCVDLDTVLAELKRERARSRNAMEEDSVSPDLSDEAFLDWLRSRDEAKQLKTGCGTVPTIREQAEENQTQSAYRPKSAKTLTHMRLRSITIGDNVEIRHAVDEKTRAAAAARCDDTSPWLSSPTRLESLQWFVWYRAQAGMLW